MITDLSRTISLLQPPTITFGIGAFDGCASAVHARWPGPVAIISSKSVSLAADRLAANLLSLGATTQVFLDTPPEPDVDACERLRERVRTFRPTAVIGLGGGSVLDVAKLVAALNDRPDPVGQFFGSGLVRPRRTALICLPTTAGTGSEVSPNAILYDPAERLKKAVISPHLVPDLAIVDPQLTASAPAALTAATGIDALVHCLEAYANRFAHPLVDLFALEGIRLIAANLPAAVRNGGNLEARSAVALGSLYGGMSLGPVNTAAVHALAYPLGSEYRLAHGLSNALLLPHVVRFNVPAATARYAAIAGALGDEAGGPEAEIAGRLPDRLQRLCAECGVPSRLSTVGVAIDSIPRLAAAAMKVTRLLKNNPREVTLADAEAIYRAAW